ncbi:glycosyl transferase group 1 [halophilic archaeon DL31]|jgi:glycosyltransferase involved in cell wall biosynthesis|nr:glycosyl transferase group 1 [halophilic archaeon DL31]
MKVCMVLGERYPPDARVRKETAVLRDAGHDVRVLTERRSTDGSTGGADEPRRETVNGVDVLEFTNANPSSGSKLARIYGTLVHGTYPRWDRRVREQVDDGVDIVHVHDLELARTALRAAGDCLTVLDLHENYPEAVVQYRRTDTLLETVTSPHKVARRVFRPKRHWDERLVSALSEADHTLAVVPEAKERYLEVGGVDEDISIVSNTVDTEWFDGNMEAVPVSLRDGFVLTYIGTLSGNHRGVDTAVRALAILRESVPDARLRIVGGRSKLKGELQQLAAELGIESAVEFTGWVDGETFPSHMAAADVGLVPHRSTAHTNTTVPHKLFQYMAAGLPVLATETTAVARGVREADAGVVVPPEDPRAMAEAAETLADPGTADRLGTNARRAAETTYNWSRDADRLRAVYDRLEADTP